MKSYAIILALAASAAFGAAIDKRSDLAHNLTLVLDVDDTGTNPVWRLLDENIPAHARRRASDANPLPSGPMPVHDLQRRAPECHRSNPARNEDCRTLWNSIQYSTSPVPNSPRNIVYATCYISWSKVFTGEQSRFWAGAVDTAASCGFYQPVGENGYNAVSGVIRGYLPNGAAQCLSGRATGCS